MRPQLIRVGSFCLALALLLGRAAGGSDECCRAAGFDRQCDGAGGLAAGDRGISPQACRIPGDRAVRSKSKRAPIGMRSPTSGAAATPSGAITSRSMLDDYVLTQPPVYTGPKRPVNPAPEPEPERPPREHKAIPVVADLLQAAAAAVPVHAATAGERDRIQARLCPRRSGGRADARAGGAGLFVRDRRHRQLRRAVGHRAWRHPRDFHRDRLQPAAHHQQRRTGRRAGPRTRPGADRQGRAIVRRRRARRWTTRSRC